MTIGLAYCIIISKELLRNFISSNNNPPSGIVLVLLCQQLSLRDYK